MPPRGNGAGTTPAAAIDGNFNGFTPKRRGEPKNYRNFYIAISIIEISIIPCLAIFDASPRRAGNSTGCPTGMLLFLGSSPRGAGNSPPPARVHQARGCESFPRMRGIFSMCGDKYFSAPQRLIPGTTHVIFGGGMNTHRPRSGAVVPHRKQQPLSGNWGLARSGTARPSQKQDRGIPSRLTGGGIAPRVGKPHDRGGRPQAGGNRKDEQKERACQKSVGLRR